VTKIANLHDLRLVAATLHDARFTADGIEFNATTHGLVLKCWQLEAESGEVPQQWKAFRLSFTNVSDCKVSIKETVAYYELATMMYSQKDHKLDIIAHYGIEIRLVVDHLDAALTETSEIRATWE
jgi:hypothetical protein